MEQRAKAIGSAIIGSAIIWGAVILGCSYKLRGTGCYDEIQNILVAGVLLHIILIWGTLALSFKRKKQE